MLGGRRTELQRSRTRRDYLPTGNRKSTLVSLPLFFFFFLFLFLAIVCDRFAGSVRCYQCEVENENCADPLNPEAEGVSICEGEFCIKSSTMYQGIPVAMRFCSDRARVDNDCVTEVVQGIPAEGCACSEDFCNGPPVNAT